MAAPTRPLSPSIFPKRNSGLEPTTAAGLLESGELLSIEFTAPSVDVSAGRSRGDRFHNLRRQAEAHVFRHDFQFLHVGETLLAQITHGFFDQMLRSRSTGGEGDGLHFL